MWSIAPLGNEIRYRVISRLLSRRPAPAASQPRPYAVETDKPPKTHRCSGRPGFTSSGVIPQRWHSRTHRYQKELLAAGSPPGTDRRRGHSGTVITLDCEVDW